MPRLSWFETRAGQAAAEEDGARHHAQTRESHAHRGMRRRGFMRILGSLTGLSLLLPALAAAQDFPQNRSS